MDDRDFLVGNLGERKIKTPIRKANFIDEESRLAYQADVNELNESVKRGDILPSFEYAGPREKIYHDPAWCKAAILTAGGLCPGLNDVIRSLTRTLLMQYGVPVVYGIRYGYRGLIPRFKLEPIVLTEEYVDDIHTTGGTILGSSRGRQDEEEMVDTLARMNINLLFCIGGDGTLRCAHDVAQVIQRRKLSISVVGIPQTIDNEV